MICTHQATTLRPLCSPGDHPETAVHTRRPPWHLFCAHKETTLTPLLCSQGDHPDTSVPTRRPPWHLCTHQETTLTPLCSPGDHPDTSVPTRRPPWHLYSYLKTSQDTPVLTRRPLCCLWCRWGQWCSPGSRSSPWTWSQKFLSCNFILIHVIPCLT
jgi:hypothetical protein